MIRRSIYSSTVLHVFLWGLMSVVSVWAAYHGISNWSDRVQRGFWDQMGMVSLFVIIGSVSVWLLKEQIIKVKLKNREGFLWANGSVIKGLREAHVALGWLAFDLGLGHSVYFMVNLPTRMNRVYSGVIALAAMTVLIITGLLYRHKILSFRTIKKCHLVISGVFGILLVAHI
ncbi:membrane hypothetical protein [Candidatus Desulfosporosinus infrequens]|uniref:Ferric oxidoreductase domain-containing protein n=1 Tax=Candidatus Desulfosporosinus infrequens TaxID=2043169 RepID=A0A2U3KWI7_9FIRM|nr:membrane hypothetical protein [Candidatus Desulfosporosinus infrequens]